MSFSDITSRVSSTHYAEQHVFHPNLTPIININNTFQEQKKVSLWQIRGQETDSSAIFASWTLSSVFKPFQNAETFLSSPPCSSTQFSYVITEPPAVHHGNCYWLHSEGTIHSHNIALNSFLVYMVSQFIKSANQRRMKRKSNYVWN